MSIRTIMIFPEFDDVSKCNDIFSTVIKKVSVEIIGEHEESIIVIEHELN